MCPAGGGGTPGVLGVLQGGRQQSEDPRHGTHCIFVHYFPNRERVPHGLVLRVSLERCVVGPDLSCQPGQEPLAEAVHRCGGHCDNLGSVCPAKRGQQPLHRVTGSLEF